MLVNLGPSRQPPQDFAEHLLECHDRIRRMTELLGKLASVRGAKDEEAREVAERVRRYFADALPRHVADEEETLLPALRGRDPAVDAALAEMHAEHGEHEADVERAVALCARIAADPIALDAVRAELEPVASRLASAFRGHLEREEAVIFPALRRLLFDEERAALLAQFRARRSGA